MSTQVIIGIISIAILFALILGGCHIAVSLGVTSFFSVLLLTGKSKVAISVVSGAAYSAIREYSFVVLPLFLAMGVFMSKSGAAAKLFTSANWLLKKLPGGLAIATILSNAVFAAVTGVSVASAAVFSKVAMPEMVRFKYNKSFAVGSVAGSSVLGMLIPPSALMIIYGMQSEESIGSLFMAGVVPGIILALIMSCYILIRAFRNPSLVGWTRDEHGKMRAPVTDTDDISLKEVILGPLPTIVLIIVVMGGMWGGFFTTYEAAGIGCLGAFIISIANGMRWQGLKEVILETSASGASILLLLTCATMYSRMLTMSGLVTFVSNGIIGLGLSTNALIILFSLILLFLGCILDSTSILLLTCPLILPVLNALNVDLIWYGIIMIVVVEMGLLTPPFGMCVFAVDAAVDKSIGLNVNQIFAGSTPYLLLMVILVALMILFPPMVTWLPGLMG